MGSNLSQLERELGANQFANNEHFIGLVNFGNTCYCNSVLQALYFCKPFRDMFKKRKVGSIPPKKFIQRLRKENVAFDNYMQHDAHEFLNYLLNTIADLLQVEKQNQKGLKNSSSSTPMLNNTHNPVNSPKPDPTWIHDIFQGTFTSETRCLNCETVRSREEDFLDLSIEVEQNTSITHCLQAFSNTETLCSECKYYCEVCCSKQEAQKRIRVKKLPHVLALHLKRFKLEHPNRSIKLSYRVVFPLELRLFNTSDDACNPDRMYDLISVVIHCGSGLTRGHYISIVKSHGLWLLFDDDIVDKIEASAIEDFYGLASDLQKTSESGYILFYQSRE